MICVSGFDPREAGVAVGQRWAGRPEGEPAVEPTGGRSGRSEAWNSSVGSVDMCGPMVGPPLSQGLDMFLVHLDAGMRPTNTRGDVAQVLR